MVAVVLYHARATGRRLAGVRKRARPERLSRRRRSPGPASPLLALSLLATLLLPAACDSQFGEDFQSRFSSEADRVWIGPEYWSNPMQDWRLRVGRIENVAAGGDRNVFLLTREVSGNGGDLHLRVRLGRLEEDLGRLEEDADSLQEGFVGFRVGIRGSFDDYRDSAVRGVGLNAGLLTDGRLFIGNPDSLAGPLVGGIPGDVELRLDAEPVDARSAETETEAADRYQVRLAVLTPAGDERAVLTRQVPAGWLVGGLALVSHSGPVENTPLPEQEIRETGWTGKPGTQRGGTVRFWFRDWKVSGSSVAAHPERAYGPILFTLHTLSRGTLNLTAQMAPVGNAPRAVWLEIADDTDPGRAAAQASQEGWRRAGESAIDPDARTARFRVPEWDDTRDTPYRVIYEMPDGAGRTVRHAYTGTIRRDPVDKPELIVAAFTGNNDLGFPHADIVRSVRWHQPDFLAYTGDNIYERVGEYGIQREPTDTAILDYLRKWYLFGWEYRELLKDIPSVSIPDDHDVYHGNVWGAGGRAASPYGQRGQDAGGYTMAPRFVNAVQRTQTSHFPEPFDATPVEQGITVYYTDVLYGGVSFAVLEDRKWKSSPTVAVPAADIVNGWSQNPDYVAATQGDVDGAVLLGERQLEFLEHWAADWSGGAWMKAVISQTIFANVATLPAGATSGAIIPSLPVPAPGEYAIGERPVSDHDSNGWPQTPRDNAVRKMRKAFAVHLAGDQHLASTIQYGIEEWNDAGWALCVPSVANIWPRRWFPPEPGGNHVAGRAPYTGEYLDGFGNRMTVHAVANPAAHDVEPTAITHRAPGYGIARFDRESRQINLAAWPRWVDPAQGGEPYAGWPITINQLDNGFPYGGPSLGLIESEIEDPVIQVSDSGTGQIVYTIRIRGRSFEPRVRRPGLYEITVFDPDTGYNVVLSDRQAD